MKNSKEPTINWYPGHMLRAKKQLTARLKQVDVVLEVRDARIPMISENHDLADIVRQKHQILVFNKTDLADPKVIEQWKAHFGKKSNCLFINTQGNQGISQILPKARQMMQQQWQRYRDKSITPPRLRMVVAGVPNVGKSTIINRLAKKHAAETGPRPGVTKRQDWIRLGSDVELLDTPGILWPKFQSNDAALCLALTGAIKDEIVGEWKLAKFALNFCQEHYPDGLENRYQLSDVGDMEIDQLFEHIAKKRGCLKQGGVIDEVRTANQILHDFREGQLGRTSLEHPPMDDDDNQES